MKKLKISKFCQQNNVKLHLDGARIWNASAETGISLKEYCSYFDSVSLCLSKTLGAPIGTVLVSDKNLFLKLIISKQNGVALDKVDYWQVWQLSPLMKISQN